MDFEDLTDLIELERLGTFKYFNGVDSLFVTCSFCLIYSCKLDLVGTGLKTLLKEGLASLG
jgi:hypothetical protein